MQKKPDFKETHGKLTKSYVESIPTPEMKEGKHTYKIYRDGAQTGFAVRVSSTGVKTFIVDKKSKTKLYRVVVGKFPDLSVEEARTQAQKCLGQVAMGINPHNQRRYDKAMGTTLLQAFEDYLRARKDLKERTRSDYEKTIEREFEDWKIRPIVSITKEMIATRHTKIGQRTKIGADNAFKVLQAIFNFARGNYQDSEGQPIIRDNPVDRLSDTKAWYGAKRKSSVIKINQLPAWYKAVLELSSTRRTSIAKTVSNYLVAVLFTGDRKTEILSMKWSENVDFEAKVFRFFDTKNRLDFALPMSTFLYEHFKKMKEEAKSDFVFPNAENDAPFVNPYKSIKNITELSKKYTADNKPVNFTIHDLRRTFATVAESLDLSSYAIKRLLNHKITGDVTAGYIITEVERLRKPIQRVTDCLLGIIEGRFTSYEDF